MDSLHRKIRRLLNYAEELLVEITEDTKKQKIQVYIQLLVEHEKACSSKISTSNLQQLKSVLDIIQEDLWRIEFH